MKAATRYETYDGKLFETQQAATRHLDQLFGALITGLAHRVILAEKYTKVVALLEHEVATMREIIRIKDDMVLPAENPEDT